MAEPFLGEIRLFSFGFAPKGWALCNGQLLPINQNQALFSLLGNNYGGDGRVNFALPNLQGRVPIHVGGGHPLAQQGGEQAHTVTSSELPMHTHFAMASPTAGTQNVPANNMVLSQRAAEIYRPPSNLTTLVAGTIGNSGGSQAHQNMQPYLVVNFSIALQGIFPSMN
jgi:microcystin-dependent protein